MRPRSLENRLTNRFLLTTNPQRSPTMHHATSARPRVSQNKARLSEFAPLIGWHDPNIYNCLDKPPTPKALFEFPGQTSHFLSTTCDECSLRVRTFHLPRHQQHLFTSAQKKTRPAPHAPRRNKRVKQHCPRGKCTLWWSALLVYSRSLPLSDFKNCVSYQKKPSPTE